MVASALLRNSMSIEEWLAATTFVNKETLHSEKNCSLRLITRKNVFRSNYSTLDHGLFS